MGVYRLPQKPLRRRRTMIPTTTTPELTVLRPDTDFDTAGWSRFPASGAFFDKLDDLPYDDATYIFPT